LFAVTSYAVEIQTVALALMFTLDIEKKRWWLMRERWKRGGEGGGYSFEWRDVEGEEASQRDDARPQRQRFL
jgi:hypothetical protein